MTFLLMLYFALGAEFEADLYPKKVFSSAADNQYVFLSYLDSNIGGDMAVINLESQEIANIKDKRYRLFFPVAIPTESGFALIATLPKTGPKVFRMVNHQGEFTGHLDLKRVDGWEPDYQFEYLAAYNQNKAIVTISKNGSYIFADFDLDNKKLVPLGEVPIGDQGTKYFYKVKDSIACITPKNGQILKVWHDGNQVHETLKQESGVAKANCKSCLDGTFSIPISLVDNQLHMWWRKTKDIHGNALKQNQTKVFSLNAEGKSSESDWFPLHFYKNKTLKYHFVDQELVFK